MYPSSRTRTLVVALLFLCTSTATASPQAKSEPGGRCDGSLKSKSYDEALPFIRAAPPEPADEAENLCRNTTAEALEPNSHTVCPPWGATDTPYLSDCNSATVQLIKWLGGAEPGKYVTFGDQEAKTCEGQMWCLSPGGIVSDTGNCRVHLEFEPGIPGPERKESAITYDLDDKETFLEWRCAYWLYVFSLFLSCTCPSFG